MFHVFCIYYEVDHHSHIPVAKGSTPEEAVQNFIKMDEKNSGCDEENTWYPDGMSSYWMIGPGDTKLRHIEIFQTNEEETNERARILELIEQIKVAASVGIISPKEFEEKLEALEIPETKRRWGWK